MRRPTPARALLASLLGTTLALTLGALAGPAGASAASASKAAVKSSAKYTVRTLHFKVRIGANSLGDPASCDIVGDLYTPAAASRTHRVPAILTTNGFGGSKDDQAGLGKAMAARGYVVLSYSGLGFGGSGCKITLDDPSTDGRAASQLISYLGGARGIAFLDAKHTRPAPVLTVVERDRRNHLGRRQAHDPRVGMIGGSYGGEIQLATASVDPRLDTIIPMITWNDLSYSLAPDNTALTSGVHSAFSGVVKLLWGLGFSALGVADGVQQLQADPARIAPCPNFATFVCSALVTGGTTGAFLPTDIARLRHASVTSYMRRIKIPTLLMQGETDTLFNLNEAIATYRALRAQHTPVKMIWQNWGHSGSAAPGEFDMSNPDPATQYDTRRVLNWFNHYLRDSSVGTGPNFAYFRPWIKYTGIATPAYATSARFPVGKPRSYYFSGTGALVSTRTAVRPGSQSFTTAVGGLPSSFQSPDVVGSMFTGANALTGFTVPGTTAQWTSAPLSTPVDVAGPPTVSLKLTAPLTAQTQGANPATKLVFYIRVVDVAPDGTASPIRYQIAPVRVADVNKPFTITLPAIVHRFGAGHRIGLLFEGGDVNYRGGLVSDHVQIDAGTGQVLTLPVTN